MTTWVTLAKSAGNLPGALTAGARAGINTLAHMAASTDANTTRAIAGREIPTPESATAGTTGERETGAPGAW